MEQKLWQSIQELFYQVDISFDGVGSSESAGGEGAGTSQENGDIVRIRSEIRKHLDCLRVELTEYLTEQEAYFVLFPLVIYIDEQVQARLLDTRALSWPLLQRELFEVDDGGMLFYETLDHILRKPELSQFVYEVFYFCLKHGFKGRYVEDPLKIPEYRKKLETKIRQEPMVPRVTSPGDSGDIHYLRSPLWYYAAAAGSVAVVYLFLVIIKHLVS